MKATSDRFWSKVDRTESGCWIWTARIGTRGYGVFWIDGTNALAHRVAYRLTHGEIPDGLHIDHLCGVRACVRPGHLEAVTCRENLMRSDATHASRNAAKTHCAKGHPFAGDNLKIRKSGGRRCRQCGREQRAEYRARKASA